MDQSESTKLAYRMKKFRGRGRVNGCIAGMQDVIIKRGPDVITMGSTLLIMAILLSD